MADYWPAQRPVPRIIDPTDPTLTADGQYRWDGTAWRPVPLQAQVDRLVARGFRIVYLTPTAAQLVRPKQFSFAWAALSFLLCGVGVLFYVFYFVSLPDDVVNLTAEV